jgi:acyl-CoA thioester hydrolase
VRVVAELRVRYGDTDAMGVVYYANYLRYFEVARVEYLRLLGHDYRALEEDGFVIAVTEASCRYLAPARFDDLVTLGCRVSELKRASLAFEYELRRQPDDALLATGRTVHACLQKPQLRPTRYPEALRRSIGALEGLA